MTSQTTAIPKLFIGMDVHKKSWTVHFRTDLFDHKSVTMPAEPHTLIDYVEKHFHNYQVSCCYEAGCCGYWIARALQQHGWLVSVVNPGDVPRSSKQSWHKTDKIDSRNLCKQLEMGNLRGIHIPDEEPLYIGAMLAAVLFLPRVVSVNGSTKVC